MDVLKFLHCKPKVDSSAWFHDSAAIIGDVRIGKFSNIWPQAVLRADLNSIFVGNFTNIQDASVLHVSDEFCVKLGNFITVGHSAVVHACTIEDECLVGMNATILDGATIGKGSIIGANALITQGKTIPPGSLVLGSPGKVVRQLNEEEINSIKISAVRYAEFAKQYKALECKE